MSRRKNRKAILEALLEWGFDKSYIINRGVRVACSQCEAVAINGVGSHEHGCPNKKNECDECGAPIERRYRRCESCSENDY